MVRVDISRAPVKRATLPVKCSPVAWTFTSAASPICTLAAIDSGTGMRSRKIFTCANFTTGAELLLLVPACTSNSNSAPVVKLAQVNILRLRIPVPESIAAKVQIGDAADVKVQATGEHFTGKVARFTGALDMSTRTMQVEIDVPNPGYHLQPGMYADVVLAADGRKNVLIVPVNAIQRDQNKTSVLVVDPQNRVQAREVQTGMQSSNNVEIVAGLSAGERVIVGNLGSYQPGELVRPKEAVFAANSADSE